MTLPSPPDYTDKDYSSILSRIQTLITGAFSSWVDFTKSRFENILLQAFAYMMDVIAFYLDQKARETRWGTARLRKSIIHLSRLIDYILDTRKAATTDVVFSIPSSVAGDVVIPAGTTVRTPGFSNVVKFQTLAAATITAGNTSATAVSAENSQSVQQIFTALGDPGEEFILTSTPFIDGSDSVEVASVSWTRQIDLLDSGASDTHYTILVDDKDKATIKVGDGVNGAQIPAGTSVVVDYKTGGGDAGNVDATSITNIDGGPFSDSFGTRVSVSVSNPAAASGGSDRESVTEARLRAPRSLRVLNRTIARTDYEDVAIQVTGVARTLALTSNELVGVPEGWVWLYVVPDNGGQPSGALITSVESEFSSTGKPIPATTNLEVRATTVYETIDVAATVYLTQNAVEADAVTAIREALQDFFAPTDDNGDVNESIDFGFNYKDENGAAEPLIALSDISRLINDVTGVRRLGTPDDGEGITLNTNEDDVSFLSYEFPEKGNLTLTNGDTSSVIYNGVI